MCTQVKTKGARRITFSQFVEALALIGAKTGGSLADVASAVLAADGPSVTGTKAEYVKFHDDKVRLLRSQAERSSGQATSCCESVKCSALVMGLHIITNMGLAQQRTSVAIIGTYVIDLNH